MATFNKILLTGINGQVGHALYPKLQSLGEVIALGRDQLDLSKPDHIRDIVRTIKPDLIVNPAAYTAVDKAESEPELAHAINGIAPGILAEEAKKLNALLVHYSTDYVFDGTKTTPYIETDEPNPINVYGASKLAGEKAIQAIAGQHLIFRTSWVYGAYGRNFMRTILKLAQENKSLRIISDQFGAPTASSSIAEYTTKILRQWHTGHQHGIYHFVNEGHTTWFEFAKEILNLYFEFPAHPSPPHASTSKEVIGISAKEYTTTAKRPSNSTLSTFKIYTDFRLTLPKWQDALRKEIELCRSMTR
ncbi:dTDP-4-dehydrorhamnose reductase [Methylobacillus sp. Pita1]|uniref:dTDP-4-dehydrorhamnose reductase n=1 Tax=Methylobacillus sp. Pita1 TaxID=3382642 RepID=UPI0038B492AB